MRYLVVSLARQYWCNFYSISPEQVLRYERNITQMA